jgi:outer membrane receptor for ferrienterochelin and colicins
LYAAQFNPKLAASYKILRGLTVIGSVGTGFKAPDFRQQFLNFSNSLVGYTLFGANELGNGLQQLQQQGLIAGTINITPFLTLEKLLPEKSTGFNIGLRYQLRTTNITANAFYNNINNLIDRYSLPFTKINNQSIFSYANFNNVFTQGFDVNVSRQLNKRISISSGYQFLQTGDKAIIDKIQSRELVKRDPVTFVSSYVTRKEYGGLFNRSKHTANAQLAYSNVKNTFIASARAVFRSRFGYSDVNGNTILDDDREYAAGFTLVNTAVSANITKGIEVQTGVDNVLNYRDANKLPGLFGRTCYVNCNINISQLFINYKNNRQ